MIVELDGRKYKLGVKKIRRNFVVEDGRNTMETKSGRRIRDIRGTRYNFTLEIDSTASTAADYDAFYNAISAPVQSHVLSIVSGQEEMLFEADVDSGSDELLIPTDVRIWGGLQVTFTAKEPQRRG